MKPPKRKEKNTGWSAIERTPYDMNAVNDTIRALDRIAHDMERKWGCGRLETLVGPEMAAKFGAARDKLNSAIWSGEVEDVKHRAEVMARGWKTLDAAAEAAGHPHTPELVWPIVYDGQAYAVCARREDAIALDQHKAMPGHVVVSLHELLLAWKMLAERRAIEAAKAVFPGAQAEPFDKRVGDAIPF